MRKSIPLIFEMKIKLVLAMLVIVSFGIPSYSFATPIYETTAWISETESLTFDFEASESPYQYQATITDLSVDPLFGFDFLFLSITSSTETLGSIVGPGSFTFGVIPNETIYANVFGTGGGTTGAGLFGLEVSTVSNPIPEPATMLLFGTGLVCLVGSRLRKKK